MLQKFLVDESGQDLIEYALMAGFCGRCGRRHHAGRGVQLISQIFSKVASVMAAAD